MRKIDFFAGEEHFFDHISPIWRELPEHLKGTFYVRKRVEEKRAKSSGIPYVVGEPTNSELCLVASIGDYRATTKDVVFMEHGIGHQYSNNNAGYAGGAGKDRAILFLNQHHITDERNLKTYPNVPHAIIGTPKMDKVQRTGWTVHKRKPVVCMSFHWDCKVSPETRSSYPFYKKMIPILYKLKKDFDFVLHAHPKNGFQDEVKHDFPEITFIDKFEDVMKIADVYVIDNSSTMYEFLVTGKPIVVLNCPYYRFDVNHGIRFWDYIGGMQVNRTKDLIPTILDTIAFPTQLQDLRDEIVSELYPYYPNATERAVKVLVEFLEGRE
jgi:hypothetical protein